MTKVIRRKCYDASAAPSPSGWSRRVVVWLGVVLLAFNMVASVTLPGRAETASAAFAGSTGFEGAVEICTEHGMVFLGGDGAPASPSPQNHGVGQLCVFCLPLLHAGLGMPTVVAAVLPPTSRHSEVLRGTGQILVLPARFRTALFPRAPPTA